MYSTQKLSSARLPSLVILAGILSACSPETTVPPANTVMIPQVPPTAMVQDANKLYHEGQKRSAAENYFSAARNYPSPERERLMLQAAEIAISMQDSSLTNQYLNPVNTAILSNENKGRYQYIKGLVALIDKQPAIALQSLPQNYTIFSRGLANKIMHSRLRAAQMLNQPVTEARERILQHSYLARNAQIKNRSIIWSTLSRQSKNQIDQLRRKEHNSSVRGWYDLAFINKLIPGNTNINASINEWKRRFPNHEALAYAPDIVARAQTQMLNKMDTAATSKAIPEVLPLPANTSNGNIAVLLPMSGSMKTVGSTVMRGIKASHKTVSHFETSNVDSSVQYNAAVKKPVNAVVGPFSKRNLDSIARNGYLPTPLISLNYLPEGAKAPDNLYQFGLLPEDEARQVAKHAVASGKKTAVIFSPQSTWGDRVRKAFSDEFKNQGGTIAKQSNYPNSGKASAIDISALFNASADMVFFAGSPSQARKIVPSLKAANTNNLMIASTSHIFSGNPSAEKDKVLDGIVYTEIPWILTAAKQQSPELQKRYPRLFALGNDAITIAKNLQTLKNGLTVNGQTGVIRVGNGNRLHRELTMATFQDGMPVRLN